MFWGRKVKWLVGEEKGKEEGDFKVGERGVKGNFFFPSELGASFPRDLSGDGAWSSRRGAAVAEEPLSVMAVELSRSIATSPPLQIYKVG